MNMKQTKFTNSELNVEMISYVDDKKYLVQG